MKKIDWQYTFGEILIVIIGITIAFSLNKCAENSTNEREEKRYLENLKDDIETDKQSLQENLQKLATKKETIFNSFRYFSDPLIPKRDSILISNFFNTAEVIEFSPKTTTHETLINSGDLKLISNFELKTAIQEHYRKYGRLQQDYDRMENISKAYIADYFIYNIDMEKFRQGEKSYTNEKLLKSIMQSMFGALNLKQTSTEKAVKSCDEIINKLHTALN